MSSVIGAYVWPRLRPRMSSVISAYAKPRVRPRMSSVVSAYAKPRIRPHMSSVISAYAWPRIRARMSSVIGLAAGELQPRRWPTVDRFQQWAAASEQAEGSGWTKGNTEKEEENNTTTLRQPAPTPRPAISLTLAMGCQLGAHIEILYIPSHSFSFLVFSLPARMPRDRSAAAA